MTTYLITQASGQQSQWTITHLLKSGANVHAVVRDLEKVPPVLNQPGVTVFKGQSDDFDAILLAAQGCTGVFLNTFPIPGLETQQARTVADACRKAGVQTIVASTTFFTDQRDMWDTTEVDEIHLRTYYSSKAEVEDIVRSAGFNAYTILRPGFIHFDYLIPSVLGNFPELPTDGELRHAYDDEARMPHTDASDIGKYAASALQDPVKFNGRELTLINESLTVKEARDILVKVSGRDVQTRRRTPAEIEKAKETVPGQRFHFLANMRDFSGVIEAAKKSIVTVGMPLNSLEVALEREKVRLLQCVPA